jgi:hypothetical protein
MTDLRLLPEQVLAVAPVLHPRGCSLNCCAMTTSVITCNNFIIYVVCITRCNLTCTCASFHLTSRFLRLIIHSVDLAPEMYLLSYLTFRAPPIVICSYSQQDALFLKFISVKNCTYFGQVYCPSSGVLILYSQ